MDWLIGGERRDVGLERIYAAAADSAAARGLDRINIDDIAAKVGCSRATVYRHVGGKQALRDGVLARAISRVGTGISDAVAGRSGSDRMATAILAAVRVVRADPIAAGLVRGGAAVEKLMLGSPRLAEAAGTLSGTTDPVLSEWIVRVVLSLLFWPMPSLAAEELVVRQYVATAGTRAV